MPDQHGFGDYGTETTRPRHSGQSDDQMNQYDSEVAHPRNGINTSKTTAFRQNLAIRHRQVAWHDGAKHRYTPDALVVCATHQMVVEVKENEVKEDKDTESVEAWAKIGTKPPCRFAKKVILHGNLGI
jgi:hypothetical protein